MGSEKVVSHTIATALNLQAALFEAAGARLKAPSGAAEGRGALRRSEAPASPRKGARAAAGAEGGAPLGAALAKGAALGEAPSTSCQVEQSG